MSDFSKSPTAKNCLPELTTQRIGSAQSIFAEWVNRQFGKSNLGRAFLCFLQHALCISSRRHLPWLSPPPCRRWAVAEITPGSLSRQAFPLLWGLSLKLPSISGIPAHLLNFSSAPSYCECVLCLYSKQLESVPCKKKKKNASWKVNSFLFVKVIAILP